MKTFIVVVTLFLSNASFAARIDSVHSDGVNFQLYGSFEYADYFLECETQRFSPQSWTPTALSFIIPDSAINFSGQLLLSNGSASLRIGSLTQWRIKVDLHWAAENWNPDSTLLYLPFCDLTREIAIRRFTRSNGESTYSVESPANHTYTVNGSMMVSRGGGPFLEEWKGSGAGTSGVTLLSQRFDSLNLKCRGMQMNVVHTTTLHTHQPWITDTLTKTAFKTEDTIALFVAGDSVTKGDTARYEQHYLVRYRTEQKWIAQGPLHAPVRNVGRPMTQPQGPSKVVTNVLRVPADVDRVSLYNLLGEVQYSNATPADHLLDVSHLKRGPYFVHFSNRATITQETIYKY